MEEGILDIKLVDWLGVRCGNGENYPNGGWFDNKAKGLIKINARLLGIAINNPTCLVPSKQTIRVEFVFEDPFTSDNVGMRWTENKGLGVVLSESP